MTAPNRLAGERSPYLLQHQWNPVDWHPWGPEAFDRARREDKPVFLSIGYSSCHWCHVMERESFESESIAKLLNENFISVKVDREERPDVDEIYMTAVQLLTGSGGWPMSVFLTPDQRPFWGGTYFPPEDRGAHPGFATILAELAAAYRDRRAELLDAADRLTAAVRQMGTGRRFAAPEPLSPAVLERALAEAAAAYDRRHGGFGGPPKFPPHSTLRLLIHALRAAGGSEAGPRGAPADPAGAFPRLDAERVEALTRATRGTLDAMARGGLRDHVGGGFHRYATDAVWLVPHFEKMLYDNAQLLAVYADAFALWGDPEYRRAAEQIGAWTLREMTGPEGAFHSAQDADSPAGEGAYYLWSRDEVLAALGEEEGSWLARAYGIEEVGNFTDPVTGEQPGNIPHLRGSWEAAAEAEGAPAERLRERADRALARLLERRLARVPPGLDDKVLTGWNGLMIGALARSGAILGRVDFVEAAERAARFLLSTLRRDARLLRCYRAGTAAGSGYLEDYAFLASGLLDLAAAAETPAWLAEARALADGMIERFWDAGEGGFHFVADDDEALIARTKDVFDQGVPSGNGIAAQVLSRLAAAGGESRYADRAGETLRAFAGVLFHAPRASEALLLAYALWSALVPGESPGGPLSGERAREEPAAAGGAGAAEGRAPGPLARVQRGPVLASVRAPRRSVAPGESLDCELRLEIEPGWHIGSAAPEGKRAAATSVALGLAEGLAPGPMSFPDGSLAPLGGERLPVYAGTVTIRFALTAAPDAPSGRAPVVVRVRHQACDERRCLAPDTLELAFALEIGTTDPASR